MTDWLDRISMELVLVNLFGLQDDDFSKQQIDRIFASWHTISKSLIDVEMNPIIHVGFVMNKLLTSPISEFIEEQTKSLNIPQAYVDASRQLRVDVELLVRAKQAREERRGTSAPSDMLGMILEASAQDGRSRAEAFKQVVDEAITIILAGHETTSGTAQWTLHLLSQGDREKQGARAAEIQGALREEGRRDAEGLPVDGSTASAGTVQKVFYETLRIYPTIYINEREARVNSEIRVSRSNGTDVYEIPAGTNILLSPLVLHRTEANWERADVFTLGRDYDAATKEARFLPFGSGVHMCPGRHFAQAVYSAVIGGFHARFFYQAHSANSAIIPRGGISLRPSQAVRLSLKNA